MIDPSNFPDGLFSGGGLLAFAWAIYKSSVRQSKLLEQLLERIVRIDERTFQAQVRADTAPAMDELRPRRAKKQTPMIPPDEEDTKP